jgi:hypothetical protein
LEELVFNENEIETLPSNIGLLRNLQTLIADCNKLIELPVSIGSCMQLRLLSLAENQLKVLPDEIGRLSSLKVLNLNSNLISYLPFSLTKITDLQALWLSENQHKPLIQFQSEFDRESGQKVLTCFLLPQMPRENSQKSPKSIVSPTEITLPNTSQEKQVIKFSNDSSNLEIIDDDLEDRITTKLIRAPTPYPKELKAHARHARNLALKQKDPNSSTSMNSESIDNSNTELVIAVDANGQQLQIVNNANDSKSSQFEIKEAKLSKAPKSPPSARHSDNVEPAKRPNTLPVNNTLSNESSEKGNFWINLSIIFSINVIRILIFNLLQLNYIELVVSKTTKLLKVEDNQENDDLSQRSPHERKASYKVAVTNTSNSMKSPVERKIKSKATVSKDETESERGYRSDLDLCSNEKPTNDRIGGYSSDWELTSKSQTKHFDITNKVLSKECDSDSALIHMPYNKSNLITKRDFVSSKNSNSKNLSNTECDKTNGDSTENKLVSNQSNDKKSQKQKPNSDITSGQSSVTNDVIPNSSIGSLYHSSGSDRPASVSSRPSSYSSTTTSHNSSISPNDISLTDAHNETPALPPKPLNYTPLTQEPGIPAPIVSSSRLRQPQTASSQFIIHKFSHDSYTQSKLGQNSTSHSSAVNSETVQHKWNTNGINFIDDSNESVSPNSSNSLLTHFSHANRLLLSTNSNAHVVSCD